ncbi:hypothetical protein OZ411_28960, partial [Bradyrhizobium sp. Arg237L]|uniref:hypothetical protein n=1 Tax=Bradyrhizobium sp. Arg237L TaxID=3003352 RepID=UPI00249EA227
MAIRVAAFLSRHSGAMRSIEPGIHQATGAGGEMDSGVTLRVPRNDGGEKFASNSNVICLVQSSRKKHSASVVGQISDLTPRV